MVKVLVVKNGETLGWFKDLNPGITCVLDSCRKYNFDISDYELRSMEDETILWSGKKYIAETEQVV